VAPDALPPRRSREVLADGAYTLHVRVEPPTFMRHDDVTAAASRSSSHARFEGVQVERGQD